MGLAEGISFVFLEHDHWRLAGIAAVAFFGGMASAAVVVRFRLEGLMRFPMWITRQLVRFLRTFPRFLPIFGLIAAFNCSAMCLYMLAGLVPLAPMVIAFFTGMNIAIVTLTGGNIVALAFPEDWRLPSGSGADSGGGLARRENAPPPVTRSGCLRAACFFLVMLLELPAFWFTLAMGTSLESWWTWTQASRGQVLAAEISKRLAAFGMVIVPILVVSAAVESWGVVLSIRETTWGRTGGPGDGAEG